MEHFERWKNFEEWCLCLRSNGLDAIIFDSMVAPPMFSPDMYAEFALPLHRRLMGILEKSGQLERELVIGGNTAPIAALLPKTGDMRPRRWTVSSASAESSPNCGIQPAARFALHHFLPRKRDAPVSDLLSIRPVQFSWSSAN